MANCDLCGKWCPDKGSVLRRIHAHHLVTGKVDQNKKDGEMTTKGVPQKLFHLCYSCHLSWVHSDAPSIKKKFREKWGKELNEFLYEDLKNIITPIGE